MIDKKQNNLDGASTIDDWEDYYGSRGEVTYSGEVDKKVVLI